MKTTIFIPKNIRVGFQKRDGTYTGKLSYIIYYDEKGVLRKEASWNSWRNKDIEPLTFDNVPTSGFVLNKKVGGYSTGWNHRQTYVRVYDPRDFEFEISVPNLLYILENTNSIKGKGLEGEFVYGWDGKDLILIPTSSPDYIEISEYNNVLYQKNYVKAKDLILGATYKTKTNEEWIYIGRFDYHDTKWDRHSYKYFNINKGKHHFFAKETKDSWSNGLQLSIVKSLGEKFIDVVSSECVKNYADLFEKLECKREYSPYDESKDEYVPYTLEEFYEKLDNKSWFYCYSDKDKYEVNKVGKEVNQCIFRKRDSSFYRQHDNKMSIEEAFNKLQPTYKREYLQNGKLYREEK